MGNEITNTQPVAPIASHKESFGSSEMARANETASTSLAAQATATIQARYVIALQRPRNWDEVRICILAECDRPGFAEVARYSKPVGGQSIEGPSIRFAEAAMRCMGNLAPSTTVIWDDDTKRVVRVSVTDIEANISYETDVVVQKTVERRKLSGQEVLSTRTNSNGDKTYLVRATDDDLLNKQNALVSKAMRTHALRLLPGDILEEAMERVLKTQNTRDAQDPGAARKRMLDGFASIGVMPSQLTEYLGHDVTQVVPSELADLRKVFTAIRDGETSWSAVMEAKRPSAPDAGAETAQKATDAVRAKVAGKVGKKAPEPERIVEHDPSTDNSLLHDPSDD